MLRTQAQVVSDSVPQHWNSGGAFNATFQQVTLENWAGGGRNSLSLGGVASVFLIYDDTTTRRWENNLEINYGIGRIGGRENPFIKTNDNILFVSRYGRKLAPRFYLSALIDFRSQLTQGFQYNEVNDSTRNATRISEFMAPAFLVTSLGITYSPTRKKLVFKQEDKKALKEESDRDYFAVTLSPLSGKLTFVLDEELATLDRYGTEGERVRAQLGSSLVASLRKSLVKNIFLSASLNLFSAYQHPENIDVNLETLLVLKVNKFIAANVSLQLIYDDDIDIEQDDGSVGPALQLQNAVNVGLSYRF